MKIQTIFLSCLYLVSVAAFADLTSLTELVANKKPWETIEANSEQRQPYYIGASPREFIIEKKKARYPSLPKETLAILEYQCQALLKNLDLNEAQFEVWPFLTDFGDPNWVFARYRHTRDSKWIWLETSDWKVRKTSHIPQPALPQLMNPNQKDDSFLLFSDFLKFELLYQKPLYQEAVWTKQRAQKFVAGWISKDELGALNSTVAQDITIRGRILPQPARFNENPVSFVINVRDSQPIDWGIHNIEWSQTDFSIPKNSTKVTALTFKNDFTKNYLNDIRTLSGEQEAFFPISKRNGIFNRKAAFQQDNQLLEIISFLEERYHNLGLKTVRQSFTWRGIPQANLIAIIPGRNHDLPPIVLADHFDTAVAEDIYAKTHERIPNPGADDNVTATATLLRAAEELHHKKPNRDIWLLHLTGEEFPTDDLGARHFFRELLKQKQNIAGMILVDMIGIRDPKDPIYQINGGKTSDSMKLSQLAMEVAKSTPSPFVPTFRHRLSDESYLYNTDGYIADSLGFPIVFFNEHLNRHTIGKINLHYHQSTDLSHNLDLEYATHISQVAITTLWNAAIK